MASDKWLMAWHARGTGLARVQTGVQLAVAAIATLAHYGLSGCNYLFFAKLAPWLLVNITDGCRSDHCCKLGP